MKARFHLPDFWGHYGVNVVFMTMLENCPEYFREGVEIASVYGSFPQAVWNGGRNLRGVYDDKQAQKVMHLFNEHGIPLRFTFTNPVLKEEHLYDPICNRIMKMADNGLNEVIVNSPLLEEYIRREYPNYKITSSTCRMITDIEKVREEMEKDYHILVLDYNLNNKFDLLETIPHKERVEVLVNSCCDPGCPNRGNHYRLIGQDMIYYTDHMSIMPDRPFNIYNYSAENEDDNIKCHARERFVFDIFKLSTCVTPDAIWDKYIPMGFEQFKLEGRTSSKIYIIETYMQYMMKPDMRDRARVLFMQNLERNGVIRL
ncbi:MAG TPA: hypothetical protein P5092_12805 [Ruminococcus sp.]|nr:hypothetical protein [Ruminococcus sp.]